MKRALCYKGAPMANDSITSVLDGLSNDFNNLTTAHSYAVLGLKQIPAHLSSIPKHPSNPDPMIHFGISPPSGQTPAYAACRMSEALVQVAHNGPIETRLGHLWIMSFYALWDDEYRPRLAALHGRSRDEEQYDLFGDLRHLRNDAVHNGGVASGRETGKCIVLRHWFQPNEMIRLEGRHFAEFFDLIPWSDLANGSNSSSHDGF